MKLMHCSDIHLGRRPAGGAGDYSDKRFDDYFKAFEWVATLAIERNVDLVIISGDFFDKKELLPEVLSRSERILGLLHLAEIPVILVEGNHDNIITGNESDSWLIYLENSGLLQRPTYNYVEDHYNFIPILIKETIKHVIPANAGIPYDVDSGDSCIRRNDSQSNSGDSCIRRNDSQSNSGDSCIRRNDSQGDSLYIYGLGYPGSYINEVMTELADFLETKRDEKNIVIVHTAIARPEMFPGTVDSSVIDKFIGKVIYIAGGHFHYYHHYPSKNPIMFVPGSTEYWSKDEFYKQEKKGVIIFDSETLEHEFIETPKRHVLNLTISSDAETAEEFLLEFQNQVDSLEILANESVVSIIINNKYNFYFDIEFCQKYLESKNPLRTFIKIDTGNKEFFSDYTNTLGGTEEIENEIIKSWNNVFSQKPDLVSQSLCRLKEHQKNYNESDFIEEFDLLINNIMN
ncbi:MAG: metallophosphoesterase [Candidatus Kapabacteria bacterium]|nr:metallophosphoesterase [Candidatus Kapabacteria bacterium]